MQLSTLHDQLLTKARASDSWTPSGLPVGSITTFSEYAQLRYAEIEGVGTVTIDQTGNIAGMSPGERCTINGETRWMPLELLRNLRTTPFVTGAAARATGTPASPHTTRSRSARRPSRTVAKPQA